MATNVEQFPPGYHGYFDEKNPPLPLGSEANAMQFMDLPSAIAQSKTDATKETIVPLDAETKQQEHIVSLDATPKAQGETVVPLDNGGDPMASSNTSEKVVPLDGSPPDYQGMTDQENAKLLKRNPAPRFSQKSTEDIVKDLADMSPAQRAIHIAATLPVGSLENIQLMAAQLPQMALGVVGAGKAMLKNGFFPGDKEYKDAIDSVTPQWVKDLADSETMQPQTDVGQLMARGMGTAFREGSRAALPAGLAAIRAAMEGGDTETARKLYEEYSRTMAPTGEQVGNALFLSKMGHEAYGKYGPQPTPDATKAKADLVTNRANDAVDNKTFDQNAAATMEGEGGPSSTEGVTTPTATLPDAYPRLFPEYQVDKPIGESQAAFTEASKTADVIPGIGAVNPRIEGPGPDRLGAQLDYPPMENGFGGDISEHPLEDAPYMPGRLAEQANVDEMQGSHEMQFDEGIMPVYRHEDILSPKNQEIRDLLLKAQAAKDRPASKPIAVENAGTWTDASVADAVTEGRPVPPEILKDYPALQKLAKDREAIKQARIMKAIAPTDGPPMIEGVDPAKTSEFVDQALKDADKPPRKPGGKRSKQGGYIDPSAFVEGFKRLFGMSDKNYAEFQNKAAATYGYFQYPEQVINDLANNKTHTDMPRAGNIVPQNQMALIGTENPVPSFSFNHLFDRAKSAEKRVMAYTAQAKDAIKAAKANTEQAAKFFREWTMLSVKPENRGLRVALDADPAKMKEYFVSKGIQPELVDRFKPFVDINKHLFQTDSKILGDSHNRPLEYEPLYLSVQRPGRYHFLLTDETGEVRDVRANATLREAYKERDAILKKMPTDWHLSEIAQLDATKIINSAMVEALRQGNPDWLRNVAMDQLDRRMGAERRFELERNRNNEVGGWIGEVEPTTKAEHEKILKQYLDSWSNRIRESHHLENATAAIELSNKFLKDPTVLQDFPNTSKWLQTLITRHVGMDISEMRWVDKGMQGLASSVGRVMTQMDAIIHSYKPGINDNVVHTDAARQLAKAFTFYTSLAKLAWNTQVLLGNLFQILKTAPEVMLRHPAVFGVSPIHGINATVRALGYMATMGEHPAFADAKAFMKRSGENGMIDPKGQEDYSTVERAGRVQAAPGLFQASNFTRNQIEKLTNYISILTHHFFVESAFPDLKEYQKERMTYNLSRSFTADYSKLAEMYGYQKAGILGQFGTNFSKWKFNATGRTYADLLQLSLSKYGARGTLPLLSTLVIGFLNAGVYGMTGAVDYEVLRRVGQSTGLYDLKPLSAIVAEHTPIGQMKGNQRTFFERGGITALSDYTAQGAKMPSGPDVSGSIRDMSVLEAPTVAVQWAADIAKAGATFAKAGISSKDFQEFVDGIPDGHIKDLVKSATEKSSYGVTSDDMKAAIDVLPSFVQEEVKLRLGLVKKVTYSDGSNHYVVPEKTKNEGSFVRTEAQENFARAGLKTTEENNYNEGKGYERQQDKAAQVELQSLKEGIKDNLDNTYLVDRNAKRILTEHGQDALKGLLKEMKDEQNIKSNTAFFTLKELSATKMKDQIARQRAIERIQQALDVAHQ